MFQRGRLSHWCLSLFVYFLIYRFTVPLVLYGAQAQTVPSKSETQDALEKISTFLQNETGATWLAELAQSRKKAALTTDELMEALLGVTKKNSTVWQAAATLRSALAAQAKQESIFSTNLTTESSEPVTDYWSDVITDVEKHDDVICLYRKDTEAKMKKSSDWQKFLKNVSPGYTVHLALDRGSKYVICLKKVNVPTSETTQTDPPTTMISSVEDISSTIPMSTPHVRQISERDEDSATTVEATAQPSVTITTTNFPTTKATRNLIQEVLETSTTIQENSSSLKAENYRRNDNAYEDDVVKNSEDEISNGSETNYETACRETITWDNLEPETPESPPTVIVILTTAQDVGNCEESDDDMAVSSEDDCSEECDSQEMIESPRLIEMPHGLGSQSFVAGESRSSVIAPANGLPCSTNPICRMPYIAQPCPQESIPDPYQYSQSIARDLNNQIPTASVNAPFFNHLINIPTRLNSAKPSESEIEPCNRDSEYPSQISLEPLLAVEENFQRESWLSKLLSERSDSANRLPLAYPPIVPLPYQISSDYLKILFPKFGVQEVRKPSISEAREKPHPIISTYGPLSDAPMSSNPSFLSQTEENRRPPSFVEYLGARENPFGFSSKPIVPFYQTGYFPQSLMERNSRFQQNLDPPIEPIIQNPAISQATGIPRFGPSLQNPSIPKYQENLRAGNSPTFLPFNERMIPSAFASPGIPSDIFPNDNPSLHRTSLPQMPHRDQNWDQSIPIPIQSSSSSGLGPNFDLKMTIEKKLLIQGVGKDRVASGSYFSNFLSPMPRIQYPDTPHNTRSSLISKIPIVNVDYTSGDIRSSVTESRVPELQNMTANENPIEQKAPSIDHSIASVSRGIDKPIRNETGNAANFSDYIRTQNDLSNARKVPEREKLNVANSHTLHDRACPNSCGGPIPLKIKIHGSTADSIGINVVPGKGEKVKIIDAKKGLFSVERKEGSRLFDQDFNSRKSLFKNSSKKLAQDGDAESLEARVDETADKFEKHVHRKNLIEDKNLPAITATSLTDRDMESFEKSSSTTKETAKLNDTLPIIDTEKSSVSVNNTSTQLHNTSKNPNKSETQ